MEIREDGADMIWGDLLGVAGTSQLPGDIMIAIVSRLPVKSILRFKSVCRAWYSLFNHPIFIQHHCRNATSYAKMNDMLSFFVHNNLFKLLDNELEHCFLLLARSCGGHILRNLDLAVQYLHVIGSINGLVCLSLDNKNTSIVLWNPATRKHSHIPNPQLSLGSDSGFVLNGFAYDHKTDVYKFVRVLVLHSSQVAAMVEIYNTGTNTWRTAEIIGFPGNIVWSKEGVIVGGDLYWFSPRGKERKNSDQLILSFDASLECFKFYHVPPDGKTYSNLELGYEWSVWSLQAMGEHLVLMYYECNDKRYGGRQCIERVNIRKLSKFDDGDNDWFHEEMLVLENLPDLIRIDRLCGNGKIVAQDPHDKYFVCDRERTEYLPGELDSPFFYDYIESLVWPSRFDYLCKFENELTTCRGFAKKPSLAL